MPAAANKVVLTNGYKKSANCKQALTKRESAQAAKCPQKAKPAPRAQAALNLTVTYENNE